MNIQKSILFLFIFSLSVNIKAQLSTNELPVSFGLKQEQLLINEKILPVVTMPKLDMSKIYAEDEENEKFDMPIRFGYQHWVNYNIENSGIWYELPNGDLLWQLCVVCPDALSINFCYDKFWLPEGGKLFVYSKDKKHSIGAFTYKNNKGNRENVRGFATGLVYDDEVVLEYYQPKGLSESPIISIKSIVHGYRYINFDDEEGASASCMVNINCEEGTNWQNEKKAVARIVIEGAYYCSGSLINTTSLSGEPFFLTANHCIKGLGDAEFDANLDYTFFYWNYEVPGCISTTMSPYYSSSGATILANDSISDFALLRLDEDPGNLANFVPFYLGWDRSGQGGAPGVCIHHPKGDVKKISTVDGSPISSTWNNDPYLDTHWRVAWKSTLNGHGMTQGGSSGSPLLNASHNVIGQLHGSNCRDCTNPNGTSSYGKFSVSWYSGYHNSSYRRLDCWLDSLGLVEQQMAGLLLIKNSLVLSADEQLFCNIRIKRTGQLTVTGNISFVGNCSVVVEDGGTLLIDGGTLSNLDLVLKPGSFLQIINDGIIDTRSKFECPSGVIVDVQYGRIL